MAITTRCKDADLQKVMSATGVALRADDDPASVQWAREEAALIINQYCTRMYADAQLAQSSWVARKEAWLGAYYLSKRRLNSVPQSLKEEIEGTERRKGLFQILEMIYAGTMKIPDAQPRKGDIPVLSNIRERLSP